MDATHLLENTRLIPVVTLDDAKHAVPVAKALLAGGINAIEVTLRSAVALESIRRIAKEVPNILLGAGSVRQPEHFEEVRKAGCDFAVSPGSTGALLNAASLPYVPGAATASEVLTLYAYGYRLLKFFPAEASGGALALGAIAEPIPEVRFCPTGGINASLVDQYLALDAVACIGGSWFVSTHQLNKVDYAGIEAGAKSAFAACQRSG